MSARQIVQGQHVTEAKAIRARTFRRAMTAPERKLWAALRRNQLLGLHFRRQQIIDGFIADFYCHAAGLVVEVDGPHHADQTDYDAERDRILAARHLRVLRLNDDEVLRSLPTALKRIVDAIQSQAAVPGQVDSLHTATPIDDQRASAGVDGASRSNPQPHGEEAERW